MSSGSPQRGVQRRSPRFALTLGVGLAWTDSAGQRFSLQAKATNLNLHGSSVILDRELPLGLQITIRNGKGLFAEAHIVNFVKTNASKYLHGIEFLPPGKGIAGFWGIHFPDCSSAVNRARQ